MFALGEFLKGKSKCEEYAVVPLLWLDKDNTVCYWPRVKTENDLEKLVKANAPYENKWPKYNVHRVVKSSETYESLANDLTEFLEQSTTDSGDSALQVKMITSKPSRDQRIISDQEASPETVNKSKPKDQGIKRKHKNKSSKNKKSGSKKSKSGRYKPHSSSSESSSTDNEIDDRENDTADEDMVEVPVINFSQSNPQATLRNITNVEATRIGRTSKASSPKSCGLTTSITGLELITDNFQPNHKDLISQSSPSTPLTSQIRSRKINSMSQEQFQIEVLTNFRTLQSEISRINTSLSQLAKSSQFGKITPAVKPDNFPSMPIETMEDFKCFDMLVKEEIYETYFTNRLAAIGGINIRQGVMNILKFALTNEVAMEFNWAGRDKKQPFQSTQMVKIITAAVKIAFPESPDATDVQISSAIKDWLKQAKHRNACQEKKK